MPPCVVYCKALPPFGRKDRSNFTLCLGPYLNCRLEELLLWSWSSPPLGLLVPSPLRAV